MNGCVYLRASLNFTFTPAKLFDESHRMTVITKLCLYCRHYLHFIFPNTNRTFILLHELLQNNTSNLESNSKLCDLTSMNKVLN